MDPREIRVEAAGRYQLPGVRREEGIRLQRPRALQALLRRIRRHIKQESRDARVGKVRGNLRAHRPSAEYRHRSNKHLS